MSSNKTVGLLLNPTDSWIAGTYYIHNIINSLSYVEEELRPQIKLFVREGTSEKYYKSLNSSLFKLVVFEDKKLFDYAEKETVDLLYPVSPKDTQTSTFKTIGWIPDLQYKDMPENFTPDQLSNLNSYFDNMIKHTDGIILSSNSMKARFIHYFPKYEGKVKIYKFASLLDKNIFTNELNDIKLKYNVPDKFLLITNQFWKHKDHLTAFRALKLVIKDIDNIKLFCTGALEENRTPAYINEIKLFIQDNNLQDNIDILGFIPRDDQLKLMRLATAIVHPSLYEGWSTVVEDAKHLGKTIFLSDIDVHIEQKPDKAIYFKSNNPEDLYIKITSVWENLPVNPVIRDENIARSNYIKIIKESATSFMNICTDFCNNYYLK